MIRASCSAIKGSNSTIGVILHFYVTLLTLLPQRGKEPLSFRGQKGHKGQLFSELSSLTDKESFPQ